MLAAWAWAGLCVSPAAALNWSHDPTAARAGRHLWLAAPVAGPPDDGGRRPGPETLLLHAYAAETGRAGAAGRGAGVDASGWERVVRLPGRARVIAAGGGGPGAEGGAASLWMIFEGGRAQRVTLTPGPVPGQWFYRTRPAPDLPPGLTVHAAAADGNRIWVAGQPDGSDAGTRLAAGVVPRLGGPRGGAGRSTAEPAADAEAGRSRRAYVLGLPRLPVTGAGGGQPAGTGGGVDPADGEAGLRALPERRRTMLLTLTPRGWAEVPLPAAVGGGRVLSLVPAATDGGRPDLLVRLAGDRLAVWRAGGPATLPAVDTDPPAAEWTRTDAGATAAPAALVRGGGQLLLGRQHAPRDGRAGATVGLSVLRGDRALPLAEVPLDPGGDPAETTARWSLLPARDGAAVLASRASAAAAVARRVGGETSADDAAAFDAASLRLTGVSLSGAVSPPQTLRVAPGRPLGDALRHLPLAATLLGGVLLLIAFARRNPRLDPPRAAAGRRVAPLWRRAAGGAIDLTVGAAATSAVLTLSGESLPTGWPARLSTVRGGPAGVVWPTVLLVLATAGHTTLGELLTRRSLGKLLTGTRVMSDRGGRATTRQVLLRGLLKPIDLFAYLLLVLPALSPARQRVPDLVAGTLVVEPGGAEGDDAGGSGPDRGADEPAGGKPGRRGGTP